MELKPKDVPQVELDEVERGQEVPLFPEDPRQKVRPALALQRQLSSQRRAVNYHAMLLF